MRHHPSEHGAPIAIHPLDSTDPAALNAIVRAIAAAKHLTLPTTAAAGEADAAFLRSLLQDVMMVGVAMGMTSEEPITHLAWFTELLEQAGLSPAEHILVMTLPGSYLDIFAQEHHAPSRPLQLDGGNGTGGRMSAPATRVFLLPAALYLTGLSAESGQLRAVLQSAWDEYDLELATTHPAQHPFVQLAAALSAASADGACRVLLRMPDGWHVFVSWLEQLMEESLGKGGKGIVVFDDQPLNASSPAYRREGMLRVHVVAEAATSAQATDEPLFTLSQPSLASADPQKRLSALAASFLGWQLTMALYGYLQRIQFAGQPAVENYKARARALRTQPDPLGITAQWQPALHDGNLTLLAPTGATLAEQATAFAEALHSGCCGGRFPGLSRRDHQRGSADEPASHAGRAHTHDWQHAVRRPGEAATGARRLPFDGAGRDGWPAVSGQPASGRARVRDVSAGELYHYVSPCAGGEHMAGDDGGRSPLLLARRRWRAGRRG